MNISIINPTLTNIKTIATWLWEEWGTKEPNNYNFWYSWVESSCNNDNITQTFVCIDN
jgi:hypothetical protein